VNDGMKFRIQVIETLSELHATRPQWDQLWERAADALFFQRHEWCLAAWENVFHTMRGHRLHIVTAYSGDNLVAVLPLVRRSRWWRPARFAWLTFADHAKDVLLDAEFAQSAEVGKLLGRMLSTCDGVLAISPVRETAHLSELSKLPELVPKPALVAFLSELKLGATVDDVVSELSRSALIIERRDWRRLIKAGSCAIFSAKDLSETDEVLTELVHLKRGWLAQRNKQSGWLSNDAAIAALRNYLQTAVPSGKARLTYLVLNGQRLAINLLFSDHSHHTSFVSAYSATMRQVSAGQLLMMATMRWVYCKPDQTFDLLGGENKLKRRLCNRQIKQHSFSMDCRRFRKADLF
jgi:CelD/BcsL family acetyltransferase involved in cellulose biosynthesis